VLRSTGHRGRERWAPTALLRRRRRQEGRGLVALEL
jgi:hypothetical protein